MRNRSRSIRQLAALTLIPAALVTSGAAQHTASSKISAQANLQKTVVTVKVTAINLRNVKGVVRACMTTNPKRFPKCRGDANAHSAVVPAAKTVRLTFRGVKPGRYAIALLHDENGNGKADRAFGMMPKEGFGFSRDAKVRMGPPTFKDAAFEIGRSDITQKIRMRYLL